MQITVTGRHINVNDQLRDQIAKRLETTTEKFFGTAIDAQVVFAKAGHVIETDLTIHVGHGIRFQSHAKADDMVASFAVAAERLEKRMRRHKRRMRDHHKEARDVQAIEKAQRTDASAD
jgi:ribosomal subunit interface protein